MVHDDYKSERESIFKFLRKYNWCKCSLYSYSFTPVLQKTRFKEGDFPNAEKFSNRSISLPIFYDLTDHEQEFVIENICKSYDQ